MDAITGSLIGLPNSASFRLLDLVGLDVWSFVGTNLYHAVPEDPWRDRFLMSDVQQQMLEKKWLGDKTGQGFYKRVGKEKEIHAIDLKTLEYHPAAKVKFPAADAARGMEDLGERLRALVKGTDRVGTFLWSLYSDLFLYSAEMVPEISDRIVEIDRAMRWGYAHKLGPFELWDALGFEDVCKRLESEKRTIPGECSEDAERPARNRCTGLRIPVGSRGPSISTWLARSITSSKSSRVCWCWPISSARVAW